MSTTTTDNSGRITHFSDLTWPEKRLQEVIESEGAISIEPFISDFQKLLTEEKELPRHSWNLIPFYIYLEDSALRKIQIIQVKIFFASEEFRDAEKKAVFQSCIDDLFKTQDRMGAFSIAKKLLDLSPNAKKSFVEKLHKLPVERYGPFLELLVCLPANPASKRLQECFSLAEQLKGDELNLLPSITKAIASVSWEDPSITIFNVIKIVVQIPLDRWMDPGFIERVQKLCKNRTTMNLENIPNSHRADWIDFRYDALDGKSGYDRDPYSLNIMPENLYFSQLPNSALWREAMPFVKGLLFSSETALVMSPFLENVELLQRARRPLDEENFAPYIKFDKQWQRTALLLVTSLHGEAVFDNPPEQLKAIQSEDERLAALFLVGCVPPERRLTTAIALTQFFSRSVAEKWAVPFLPITLLWNTELLQPVSIAVLFMILRNSLEAPYPEGTACLTDQATLAQIRTYADDSIVPDIIKCGYLAQISSLLRHTAFPWHLNCLHLAPKALIAAQNAINEFGTQWHYHKWPEVYAKPAVQIPLFAALQESLKTYHPREFHQLLARQILENRNLFGLFEEHPLLEQVLQVIATTSPEVVQPTHPYLIYQDLLQRATTEPLYEVEATHTWRLEKLRQAHSSQTEYTAEELPTGGDIAGLTKLVTSLQSRVATLPAMKLKVVEKHVTDNFGDGKRSLAVLCTYLLSNSTLQELLAHGKQGRELVQIAHFQASSVVSTLLKVDNELQEGELLTKREEMLLTLANLLIECRVGQRENLDSYYRLFVPIELQRGCTEAIASSEVGRFVEKVIQNLLNMTMHDEKLLLDLLSNKDPTDLTQAVHISRYLKGRLYRQIGLQYKVTIDLGTSTLPPELLQVSTANLMTTFFRHCTLTSAVNAVMEASKDFFAEGKGRYLEVANLFTEHTQESRGQLDKYFNCDEETTTISFTHQGAAAILKMLGYIGPFA